MSIKLRYIESGAIQIALDFLEKHQLPTSDIQQSNVQLYGYWDNEMLCGTGGLEISGENALIRSVAVSQDIQGKGIGSQITNELELIASNSGVKSLFLLTTTAKDFFLKRGYQVIDRSVVPDEILQTSEFKSICPLSATCMLKVLAENL